MKKYIYILLVVLILGIMGIGCDDTREVVVGEGRIISCEVYDVHEVGNQAHCNVVLKTESNGTQMFQHLLVTLRSLPQPVDSNKIYKIIKYDRDFGLIWYKISEK